MRLNQGTGNTLPLADQLEEHMKYPNYTLGETLGKRIPESFLFGTPGLAYREIVAPPLATRTITNPYGRGYRTEIKSAEEVAKEGDVLFETEEQYKLSDAAHPKVKWEKGMTRSRALVLAKWASTTDARSLYSQARPVSSFLISLGAGVADPINLIPIFGPVSKFGLLARGGIRMAEGAVANLAADALTYRERRRFNVEEMTADQMQQDIAIGAILGPVLGAAFDTAHFFWKRGFPELNKIRVPKPGTAPKPPVVPEVAPTVPEVTPEIAPVPVTPEVISERIGAEPFTPGYDLTNLKLDLESERNVILSRIVVNDGIYQYLDGDPIIMSPMSQSIIERSSSDIAYQLERNRYDLVEQPPTREEMKEITRAQKNVTKAEKEVQKIEKQIAKVRTAKPGDPDYGTPRETLSLRHFELIEPLAQAREALDNARAEAGKIRGKRYGYTVDYNRIIDRYDYSKMNDFRDLPEEVVTNLPTDVRNKINLIVANAKRTGKTAIMGPSIKFEIAPYMGPLFAGTYGRMYHATPTVFDQFDFSKTGSNTGAASASEAFFFARDPGTTTHPEYGKAESIGYDPVNRIGTYDEMLEKTQFLSFPRQAFEGLFKENAELAKKYGDLADRANELEDKIARSETKEETNKLLHERAKLEKQYNTEFQEDIATVRPTIEPHVRVQNIVLKNPYVYDWQGADTFDVEKRRSENHILAAKVAGNDGVIFLNAYEGGHIPNMAIAVFNTDQIEPGLQIPTQIKWTEPKVDVNWKVPESEIDKIAIEISKPIEASVKLDKEMEIENIDVTKPNGVADPELDRINIEAAKMGMTEAEAKQLDEQLKLIEEDMASDDRLAKASEAVIKCRNR